MMGRLMPNSSCGACIPALGNYLGRCQILRQIVSNVESTECMALGESAINQCVCKILELARYINRCYFMPCGRGVERTALLMVAKVSSVHVRCAFGHRNAARAVPR